MKHVEKSHRLRGECGLKGDYDLDQFSVTQTIEKNIKAESFLQWEALTPPIAVLLASSTSIPSMHDVVSYI